MKRDTRTRQRSCQIRSCLPSLLAIGACSITGGSFVTRLSRMFSANRFFCARQGKIPVTQGVQSDHPSVLCPLPVRLLKRLCQPGWQIELHEFLTMVRRQHDIVLLVESLCRRLMVAEDFTEAIPVFHALLKSSVVNNERPLIAFLHHSLAAVYRQTGCFSLAVLHQQSAGNGPFVQDDATDRESKTSRIPEQIPSEKPSLLTRADLFSAWGQDALIAGDYSAARDYFRRALRCEQSDGNVIGEGDDWGNLGILECIVGAERTGLQYLWKALTLHRRLGDVVGQIHDLMNMSFACEQLGRVGLSQTLLKHSQRLLGERGLPVTRKKGQNLRKRARQLQLLQHSQPLCN